MQLFSGDVPTPLSRVRPSLPSMCTVEGARTREALTTPAVTATSHPILCALKMQDRDRLLAVFRLLADWNLAVFWRRN